MLYYKYQTENDCSTANMAIYDLNAPPRSERITLNAFRSYPNSNNDTWVLEYIEGLYNTGDILDGLTPLTQEEAEQEGYLIN